MAWAGNSNPALVEAILSAFRDPPQRSLQRLSKFTTQDWKRTEIWLDTGGLGLYLLDRLRSTGISHAIDTCALRRLERSFADNQWRTADMLQEFVALNRMFQATGIQYANLKGFTLSPDSCRNMGLRRLSDHDFLLDPADVNAGRGLLEERGYGLTAASPRTLEFRSGSPQTVSFDRFYAVKPVRSVELHVAVGSMAEDAGPAVRDDRLDRLVNWTCEQGEFPALCPADQLIGQATHLLSHLRSEHSRPAWYLEFRNHVLARKGDEQFWKEVHGRALGQPETTIALGLSTLLATDLFGPFSFPALDSWTLDALPPAIKLWGETYGRRAVLTDVPGTKLYLLLESVLGLKPAASRQRDLKVRLLPKHGPPRILRPPPQDTIPLRIRREIIQLRYAAYRLRFHLKQGAVYLIETARWRKLMKKSGVAQSQPSAAGWQSIVEGEGRSQD